MQSVGKPYILNPAICTQLMSGFGIIGGITLITGANAITEFTLYDAKQEWLNVMAKRGVAANFLSPNDKTRYKETMNRIWGLS